MIIKNENTFKKWLEDNIEDYDYDLDYDYYISDLKVKIYESMANDPNIYTVPAEKTKSRQAESIEYDVKINDSFGFKIIF